MTKETFFMKYHTQNVINYDELFPGSFVKIKLEHISGSKLCTVDSIQSKVLCSFFYCMSSRASEIH